MSKKELIKELIGGVLFLTLLFMSIPFLIIALEVL